MKKLALALMLSLALSVSTAEAAKKKSAQNIDFGSFSCADFIEMVQGSDEDSIGAILLWMDGYLSGVSGDTELNWKGFEEFSGKIATYCSSHGKANLLEASKKVGVQ